MKKRIYLICVLIVMLVGIAAIFTTLLLLSYRTNQSRTNLEKNDTSIANYPKYVSEYLVTKGSVSEYKSYDATITVIDTSLEIMELNIQSGLLSVCDFCKKGAVVGNYTFDFNGRVFEVVNAGENDVVKVINYDNRKFTIYVKNNDLNTFKYGSQHRIYVGNSFCMATVTYIDVLLSESTYDAVKVELEVVGDSLSDDIFLLVNSTVSVHYEQTDVDNALRVFKSAFGDSRLVSGDLKSVVVKKKSTGKYVDTRVQIGIMDDSYVQIIGSAIEEGDVICV